ncbi:hypothetical protein MACK_003351 [Theileria orientalis]|uniref:RING-type domain-containing protein n=1 Tax=Theileria orientalis TaxID=68886 RepID=A0A976XJ54_THEOR|nr:hypothetical protein MACK_003351 [Theileria orientalis]
MENCVIKNSKRPYHSTMGPLLDDFDSLSKRRKKLFDNINNHIDNLIQLLQDTDDKLSNHGSNHINGNHDFKYNSLSIESSSNDSLQKSDSLNGVILKYESSDTGNETSSTDFNNEPAMCDCTKQSIRDLACTVKSYDVYRSINKLIKEFNHHFNEMGKPLLGTRGNESHEMISPVKLDDQLVCRMIGIHLLHYGMFDVYEELKKESIKLWGENNKGTVGELMVEAYKTLHDLIDKIRSCNIDPVLEWTKMQSDCSNLHVQRFNEIIINLYKIRFLKELFEADVSNTQIIDEVKKSGLTSLWKIHNDEIGKLVTQVILGENLPSDADFDELKNKTIKMFTKLFCETGILMKKPPNYDRKPLLSDQSHQSFAFNAETSGSHEVTELTECADQEESEVTDVLAFSWRPILTETKSTGSNNDKLKYKSWILALTAVKDKSASFKLPEDKGVRLRDDWLNPKGQSMEKMRQPRMASKYLNSNSLEHGRRLNFIKNRVALNSNVESPRSISRALLMKALSNQEQMPRQSMMMNDNAYSNFPYYLENQLCEEEVSSFGRFVDPEDWVSTRNERGTTVLIATGSEENEENLLGLSSMGRLIDNYPSTMTQTEENQTRSTPTFSLTVFAGPSIFRDSRVSSQLLEADIISQRLLNVSPGSRIRIRFPTRSEEALENAPRRRETTISPYEQIASEPSNQPEEEEHTTTMERSSITLRDILRMIMRGLRTETQPAVLRFRGSQSHHNLEDTRTTSQDTESPKDKMGTHKRLVRPKQEIKIDQCVDSEYIKVHLPYESPLSVVICAGHVTFPYLLDVLKVLFKERCEVSSKVGMWLKSNQQLPVESDLGPAFHFHSYLTCAVSKDQTSSENLPIMLSCGHVICKICHDRLSGKRRKRQFKCPMCPTIVEPNQVSKHKILKINRQWNCTWTGIQHITTVYAKIKFFTLHIMHYNNYGNLGIFFKKHINIYMYR